MTTRQKKKLLVLTSTFPRHAEDTEPRFVFDLSKALARDFDVTVLAPASTLGEADGERDGLMLRWFRYFPVRRLQRLAAPGAILPNLKAMPWLWLLLPCFLLAEFFAILRLCRTKQFDAIHCHWIVPQGIVLRLAGLFVSLPPVLLTCHGGDVFALNNRIIKRLKMWVVSRFHYVAVVSDEISGELESWPFPADRRPEIRWIPMGVDATRFAVTREPGKTTDAPLCLLFVGRLAEKKGLTFLLKALAQDDLKDAAVDLTIVGDGPLRSALEAEAQSLGLSARVHFLGARTHADLPSLMVDADAFIAPFVVAADGDREGLPTVLMEAAMAGLPIISTPIGGVEEVLHDGDNGILVQPKDVQGLAAAIHDLAAHREKLADYGAASKRVAQRFSWDEIGAQYQAFLKGMLED